jgi:hypothetical protein
MTCVPGKKTHCGTDHDRRNALPVNPRLFDGALNGEPDTLCDIGSGRCLERASDTTMRLLGLMRVEDYGVGVGATYITVLSLSIAALIENTLTHQRRHPHGTPFQFQLIPSCLNRRVYEDQR